MKRESCFICMVAVWFFMMAMIGSCKKPSGSGAESSEGEGKTRVAVQREVFGKMPGGRQVDLYTLTNSHALKAKIMTLGAVLVSLEVPDRNSIFDDVTLGYDTLAGYIEESPYFGAIVGRYANRIARGRFTLDGVEYRLATNDGDNHLHGGTRGFDRVIWNAVPVRQKEAVGVKLTYLSRDGEEGYPGNLECNVTYILTEKDELKISYEATTDRATPVNLTHHSYFNLAGQGKGDILGHELMLNADRFTPADEGLIPTGELRSVKNSPVDFTSPRPIGEKIHEIEGGYDHNFVLNSGGGSLALAARVCEPATGRVMEIYTTEPGIQFYSGNFLDGSITGKSGKVYRKHYGFCLEAQHFPDSPNKPSFPSVIIHPGEKYTQLTVHRFYTK